MRFAYVLIAILFLTTYVHSQHKTDPTGSSYLVVLNKKYEPFKEINIGDKVRLVKSNSNRVKGNIRSIDSASITIENNVVRLDQIKKITTKKIWVQGVLGGVLLAGGIACFTLPDFCHEFGSFGDCSSEEKNNDVYGLLGVGLIGGAIVGASPNYHKIGKNNWLMVVTNKPPAVSTISKYK